MKIKLKPPSIPHAGWTTEEDSGMKTFDPTKLVLHLEPEQEAGYISGNELRNRLNGKHPLSASVLDYLIEHPELAPESWKEKTKDGYTRFIYFWGTIYRGQGGNLYVRFWYWRGGRWLSNYRWLDRYWSGLNPSALLASTSSSDTQIKRLDAQSLELPDELTINGVAYRKV